MRITVFGGTRTGSFEGVALSIVDGAITIGSRTFENIVPLVLDETGHVVVSLTLANGVTLTVTGTRPVIEPTGEGRFVERFAGVDE